MNTNESNASLPYWAKPLGQTGYNTFVALIKGYFAERNLTIIYDEAEGLIRPSEQGAQLATTFGLQNLMQLCAQASERKWAQLVRSHFDSILNTSDDENALKIDMSRFAQIAGLLRARLYPENIRTHYADLVTRNGPIGTLEVLALDLPTTVRTVARSEAEAWGFDFDELFEIGRQNLRNAGLLSRRTVMINQSVPLTLFSGDAFYGASHALILNEYLPANLPHGALIGIPKRDVLLMHEIRNAGVFDAIPAMIQVIVNMHRDGPGSISPNLYWVYDGEIIYLPTKLVKGDLSFDPPPEFSKVLNAVRMKAEMS
ncbi:MAG: DUF1444 family protein [Anaerolineae bacterium]|nr:DUF1444 family protein [Anaerolineae bacterium]